MGFRKRFISKEVILSTRNKGESVTHLFNADAVICTDPFSIELFYMFLNGSTEEQLKSKVLSIIHLE